MPKLTKKVQKAAAAAPIPSGSFEPLEPGRYVGELTKVEAKTSQAGNPVWNVEFSNITALDGTTQPGRLWYNLNMPQDEMPEDYQPALTESQRENKWEKYQGMVNGRLHGFFEAFSYTVDSDTDEMIGERCVLEVGVQTIQRGARAGQLGNQVNNVLPLSEAGEGFDAEDKKDGDDF